MLKHCYSFVHDELLYNMPSVAIYWYTTILIKQASFEPGIKLYVLFGDLCGLIYDHILKRTRENPGRGY